MTVTAEPERRAAAASESFAAPGPAGGLLGNSLSHASGRDPTSPARTGVRRPPGFAAATAWVGTVTGAGECRPPGWVVALTKNLQKMLTQWRRLGFFDKEPVKGLEEFENVRVTSVTSGRGQTILGDADGWIALCDRTMCVTKFRGFDSKVNHLLALSVQLVYNDYFTEII